MGSRILKSMLLIAASMTTSAITSGDAVSAVRRQSAVVWLKEPTLIVSTIVQGPVVFTHDDDKMARGELGCFLTEYQFAGDTEGHGVPLPLKLVERGGSNDRRSF